MSKERTNKKNTYSTAPLFLLVMFSFFFTSLISIFILDVENFYASESKQISKKKLLQTFCVLKPTTSNIYGDVACDKNTYVEFDIFQYIDENDYHRIQYSDGKARKGSRCGLRKDYQFGDWSMLDKSGKPYYNVNGNSSYSLKECIEYVLKDFCSSEFRSYDIYSFPKKGWKYECRIDQSLFGPNIVKKAERYIEKNYKN